MRALSTDEWHWSRQAGVADDHNNPGPELIGDLFVDPMEDFSEPEAERYDPEAGSESSEWSDVSGDDDDQESDISGLGSEPDELGLPQDTLSGNQSDSSESGGDSVSMRDVDRLVDQHQADLPEPPAASTDSPRDGEESDTTWNGFSDGFEESESEDEDEQDPRSLFTYYNIPKAPLDRHQVAMVRSANLEKKGLPPWTRGNVHELPFNTYLRSSGLRKSPPTADLRKMMEYKIIHTAALIYMCGTIHLGDARCSHCKENQIPIPNPNQSRSQDSHILARYSDVTVNDSCIPICVSASPFNHGICASCYAAGGSLDERVERCSLSMKLKPVGKRILTRLGLRSGGHRRCHHRKQRRRFLVGNIGNPLFVGEDNAQRALVQRLLYPSAGYLEQAVDSPSSSSPSSGLGEHEKSAMRGIIRERYAVLWDKTEIQSVIASSSCSSDSLIDGDEESRMEMKMEGRYGALSSGAGKSSDDESSRSCASSSSSSSSAGLVANEKTRMKRVMEERYAVLLRGTANRSG